MPVFEPGKILTVVLPSDAKRENPPTWQIKALSCRESMELGDRLTEELKGKDDAQQFETLAAILDKYVAGWDGLTVPYAPGKLLDVCGPRDLYQLDNAIRYNFGVTEKKA